MKKNNIDRFNTLTGLLLARLYETFPRYYIVEFDSFGEDLLDKDELEGAFGWDEFVRHSITWLGDAGYVWLEPGGMSQDSVSLRLSPSGLELLKSTPDALKSTEPLGERLKRFAKDRAADAMKEVVSQMLSFGIMVITQKIQAP